ncbi:hypothetical protein PU03_13880 [Escherichia coli]|nr:hypothetical protein PU03_13880 [Escherichia coli]
MLPSETMIWQPEFTDKTLSRKPGAVHTAREHILDNIARIRFTVDGRNFSRKPAAYCSSSPAVMSRSCRLPQNGRT